MDMQKRGAPPLTADVHSNDLCRASRTFGTHGKFPADHVAETIRVGPRDAKAHGSHDMPVWGNIFMRMGGTAEVDQRIHNLTSYIETLQAK